MIELTEVREWHVIVFAFQVSLGLFTATTGCIDVSYGQYFYGGLGLITSPVLFWLAYLRHKKLRSISH